MTEYTVQINGIKVSARYSERAVHEIFVPLLEKLTAMQRAAGRRILVMLAAPPGAGKSTLVSFLEKLSRERPGLCPVQAVNQIMRNEVKDICIRVYSGCLRAVDLLPGLMYFH